MKEIEVKILNVDLQGIKKAFKTLGAKSVLKPTLFEEWYFEIPGVKEKERKFYSLRLRAEGKKNILTAKLQKEDQRYHVNEEVEIEVSDIKRTRTLLILLGFHVFRQREKIRETYQFESVKIVIDKYPGIRPYIEIESLKKGAILSFIQKLGYSAKDTTNKTATEVIKEAGLNPDRLFFKRMGKA